MDKNELLRMSRDQIEALPIVDMGDGNIECVDCSDCIRCKDCDRCKNCDDCTSCIKCVDCTDCYYCLGISNAVGLKYVAYGVRVTPEEFKLLAFG